MNILGLTGGIGAGKSSVALLFQEKGIPVFNADNEAKKVYTQSDDIKKSIIELLGEKAYENNLPDRMYIAKKVFSDKELLQQLNHIIHPALQLNFAQWTSKQAVPFVVKEAAILFESNSYKQCNAVLTVTADAEVRLKRVMQRDQTSEAQVLRRMSHQWPERRKIELSDFVLYNNYDFKALKTEFEGLFQEINFKLQ